MIYIKWVKKPVQTIQKKGVKNYVFFVLFRKCKKSGQYHVVDYNKHGYVKRNLKDDPFILKPKCESN